MRWQYFTEDHDAFRDSVRKFVEKEIAPHVEAWEKEGGMPKGMFKKLGDMGYLGINFPEKWGGSGLDMFYSVAFLEEMAKCGACGPSAGPSVHSYMAIPPLFHLGSDYIKETYLKPAIAGDMVAALCISEPNAGSDVAAIQTYAKREGDYYVINGSKTFITNGCNADFITLACKTSREGSYDAISMIVVDAKTPGYKVTRKLDKLGWWSSDTAELSFTDMRVPVKNLLGEEGKGFYYVMNNFQMERLVAAILSIGGIDYMLKTTLTYMASREAFGRPISRYQVLRHRIADLATELEGARALTYQCCYAMDKGDYCVKEITMAKLLASELAIKVADECLQMYGGYGAMEEYPAARMYRDTRIGTIAGGTSEVMREILAKMVIDGMDFRNFFPKEGEETAAPLETASSKATVSATPQTPSPVVAAPIAPAVPVAANSMSSAEPSIVYIKDINDCADIFRTLPLRMKADKVGDTRACVQFKLSGPKGGDFTVFLEDGTCRTEAALSGTPDCVIQASDETYLGIEFGKVNPQMAFMMGKIKVSNVGLMMKFTAMFARMK